MTATLERTVTLETHGCGVCGITFAAPEDWWRERRADGATFYCPNGHPRVYRETDVQRLTNQLAAERRNKKFYEDRWLQEKRSKAAIKGQLTKTRNRVANGVCPCCSRTFVDLGRHMAGQHPEYSGHVKLRSDAEEGR